MEVILQYDYEILNRDNAADQKQVKAASENVEASRIIADCNLRLSL